MRKPIYLMFLLVAAPIILPAQRDEAASVTEVINRLFSGMYRADSTMIRSAFAKEVTMVTAFRNKEGVPVLRREYSINDFVKAVGQPQPEPLTEEIWNIKIQIDGDFAQA